MKPGVLIQTLTIIHACLLAGLAGFAIFAYSEIGSFEARMDEGDIFIYLVPLIAAAGYFLSQLLFRKQLQSVTWQDSLSTKLGKYQSASVLKYALLEGPAILALIAYYSSGNALHLVIALAVVAYLFVQRPTLRKVKKDLPLSNEEEKQI